MGNPTGQIDWSKIFMGFAMALVFVMQQWHSIQMSDIRSELVPRAEMERHTDKFMEDVKDHTDTFMNRNEILDAFKDFSKRLEYLEENKGNDNDK